jgi:hypothetical protein
MPALRAGSMQEFILLLHFTGYSSYWVKSLIKLKKRIEFMAMVNIGNGRYGDGAGAKRKITESLKVLYGAGDIE